MLGLVLEGGGAKGSYHAGAIKALFERNYDFDGVMGTSIGAVNGALIAQGDTEKCIELWETVRPSDFVDVDDKKMLNIFNKNYDKESMGYLFALLRSTLANKGFSRERIMRLLKFLVDEDKLRLSKKDFGIVTVSITDRMPMEIFKEEIPYGHLHDYIMASAYFPAFRLDPIYGKKYFDGGVYDNLPINPLIRRGYDEIIAIRTNSNMPHQMVIDDTVKVTYINPSDDIGGTISVYASSLERNIKMGYFDAVRALDGQKGKKYYFFDEGERVAAVFASRLNDDAVEQLRVLFGMEQSGKEAVIRRLFCELRARLKTDFSLTDYEVLLAFFEKCAEKCGLERFCVHNIESMLKSIKNRFENDNNIDIISFNNLKLGGRSKTLNSILEIILRNYF